MFNNNNNNNEGKRRLDAYRGHKNERQKIVRKMNKKRTLEIFIQRSQGSLLQKQIKFQQVAEIKVLQEIKANNMLLNKNKRKTFSFNNQQSKIRNIKRHGTQVGYKNYTINNQEILKIIEQSRMNNNTKQIHGDISDTIPNLPQSIYVNQNLPIINNQVKKLSTRPALQELQNYLKEEDPFILQRRKRIIQMLILCLMRRCHHKLCEALDVALQAYTFFFDTQREIYLKSLCLKLIGKIYNEINTIQKRKIIKSKAQSRAANRLVKKRHSSIMIRTLASQRVFLTRFANKYSKSKLLIETDYKKQLIKIQQNIDLNLIQQKQKVIKQKLHQQNQQNESQNQKKSDFLSDKKTPIEKIAENLRRGESVLIKINDNVAVSLPQPTKLFHCQKYQPQQQQQHQHQHQPSPSQQQQETSLIFNYNLVIHQRDIQSASKLFPYEYPLSLQNIMDKKQYIYLLSTINGLIFNETRCYDFMDVFKKVVGKFILLLVVVLLMTVVVVSCYDSLLSGWWILCVLMVVFVIICVSLIENNRQSIVYGGSEYIQRVSKQLQRYSKKYMKRRIVFRLTCNSQALMICWPKYEQQQQSRQSCQQQQIIDGINEQQSSQLQVDQSSSYMDQDNNNSIMGLFQFQQQQQQEQQQQEQQQEQYAQQQQQQQQQQQVQNNQQQLTNKQSTKTQQRVNNNRKQIKPIKDIIVMDQQSNIKDQKQQRCFQFQYLLDNHYQCGFNNSIDLCSNQQGQEQLQQQQQQDCGYQENHKHNQSILQRDNIHMQDYNLQPTQHHQQHKNSIIKLSIPTNNPSIINNTLSPQQLQQQINLQSQSQDYVISNQ